MKNDRVLFKIKGLEKLLIRSFSKDIVRDVNIDNFFPHPTPTQMQIIEYILDNCDKDIYCSCWRTSDKIHLYHAMKELGFKLSVENYKTYESNSEACKICVNNGKKENCHCSEDLYIKKNKN